MVPCAVTACDPGAIWPPLFSFNHPRLIPTQSSSIWPSIARNAASGRVEACHLKQCMVCRASDCVCTHFHSSPDKLVAVVCKHQIILWGHRPVCSSAPKTNTTSGCLGITEHCPICPPLSGMFTHMMTTQGVKDHGGLPIVMRLTFGACVREALPIFTIALPTDCMNAAHRKPLQSLFSTCFAGSLQWCCPFHCGTCVWSCYAIYACAISCWV